MRSHRLMPSRGTLRWLMGLALCTACREGSTVDPPTGAWGGLDIPTTYDVGGTTLTRLLAANIVDDARVDLMSVARGDLTVRVLPNSGAARFGAPFPLTIATDARDALAADVDGDGVADLLATGHFDNAFFVRRGLGGRQFAAQTRYALRNHGHYLAAADLNGDAYDDVIAVHDGSGQAVVVTSYLGSGSGALVQAGEHATPYFTAKGVAAGDFNGDGKSDLVVALGDNRASALVFFGLGTGQFAAPLVIASLSPDPNLSDGTSSVAAADLNGDGRDDLILARFDAPSTLVVRLSTGPAFAPPSLTSLPSPVSVAAGDVNGDGHLDVVAANLEHGTLTLLLGTGDGSFLAPYTVPVGPAPAWVTVADFDGNGFADVAVADLSDHKVRVLLSVLTE